MFMLVPVFLAVLTLFDQGTRTLAQELALRQLSPPAGATDLNRPITSYRVLDDASLFAIAYYPVEADGQLHDLTVRAFDRRARQWREARHESIGSVLRMSRQAGFLYISGHASPSAAPTLVMDPQLRVLTALDGWVELMLPDGRALFQRSMRHFQPAHAGVLAIYDPRTGTERTIYPATGTANDRGFEWLSRRRSVALDRSLSEVARLAPHRIRFTVVTRPIEVSLDLRGRPAGPERRLRVTCDTAPTVPVCVERPLAAKR